MTRALTTTALVAALIAGGTTAATAQTRLHEWYVGAAGGLFVPETIEYLDTGVGTVELEPESGMAGMFMVGRHFGKAFRGEIEFNYRSLSPDFARVTALGEPTVSGDMTMMGFMANIYADMDLSGIGAPEVRPYIGAGLGIAKVEGDDLKLGSVAMGEIDDTVLAYQLIIGSRFMVSDRVSLSADYRFYSTGELELTDTAGETAESQRIDSHNVLFGMQYHF